MPTQQRGRRRFAASKKLETTKSPARPYGVTHPLIDYGDRRALLKYFLPVVAGKRGVIRDVPLNFTQTAEVLLSEKRLLSHYPALLKKLSYYQRCNNDPMEQHPHWNATELPHELLREALSLCPETALKSYDVVRRALARLYSVAWHGHGPESTDAIRQLEQLLPAKERTGRRTGRLPDPITKHLPELTTKFRELRRWIRKSDHLMKVDFPRLGDRIKKLAELYDEHTGVISAALRTEERPFVAERLADVLSISIETARKAVALLSPRRR